MLNFLSSLWTYHLEEPGTQDTLPTSRVCGWTNSYRNCPCRVEMLFIEKKQITPKSEEEVLHRKKKDNLEETGETDLLYGNKFSMK